MRLAPTEDEDLATLSIVHRLILPHVKESSEVTSGAGSVKKMEPGSCLDSTCGNGEHTCDGRSCVRLQSFQKEDLVTWFEDITEREKSEIQIVAECYASTTVNLATALGFFSRMCSLQSLERLESEHHLVTALSVESWPGVLQVTQKHIKSWKVGLEAEMGFPMSEAYGLPLNAKSLVGSVMANLCGSHYSLHMAMVVVSSQRVLIDKAFSVPKCVRLARMSHHSHKLLRKIQGTVPKEQREDLSEIWGEELLGLEGENTSDHERQNVIGKPIVDAPNLEEIDVIHVKMMELELLLEASGERNLRSIDLTHGDCPCHCLAQTVWYPDHANLCLIWDVEEIRSLGLPDHQQKVTILVVSTMLALRWIEENIAKYRESKTPTAESIHAIDYSRRLELFETACKVFAIPMEVRHMWSRLRFFPWFRATLTSWLYVVTKDHMRKHQKEYRQFQAEIGPDAFKRPLLTHQNAITTGWKRVGRVSRNNTRARESILEEDLAKNVSLILHNSFCLNRESKVKSLPNQVKRLQEQREWMRSYEQLKAWEEIVITANCTRMLGTLIGRKQDRAARIKRGYWAWSKVRRWLWKAKVSKRTKAIIVQAVVESTMLFDCSARAWTVTDMAKMQSMADKCYRWIWNEGRGLTLLRMEREGVNSFEIRRVLGITSIRTKIETRALERMGHVLRMSNNRTTKKVILGHWTNERTQQGRLNGGVVNYWRRLIREAGEDWTNIENLTQDRKKWKATVKRRKEALEKWESEMCRYRGGEKPRRSQARYQGENLTCRWEGCGRICKTKGGLVQHERRVHRIQERVFKCDRCNRTFAEKHNLTNHRKSCKGDQMGRCGDRAVTVTRGNMASHRRSCGGGSGTVGNTAARETGGNRYTGTRGRKECGSCGAWITANNLARHERKCQKEPPKAPRGA